jgi:hypothetical protein
MGVDNFIIDHTSWILDVGIIIGILLLLSTAGFKKIGKWKFSKCKFGSTWQLIELTTPIKNVIKLFLHHCHKIQIDFWNASLKRHR